MSMFALPGFIQDFPVGSAQDIALKNRWQINAESWIQQATPTPPSFFYDPSTTTIPPGTQSAKVDWVAFPGRLQQYFSSKPPVSPDNPYDWSLARVFELADTGYYTNDKGQKVSFPAVPATLCPQADWGGPLKPFGPYGPRGWLDEYCEWSAARNADNNIVRVDFTCENPEYWYSLWAVDPERVRQCYESTLNLGVPVDRQISVTLSDLQLVDSQGRVVIDPGTGQPAYNPLNRWNSGPTSIRSGNAGSYTGGAMHLTSTPNTLQTELGLAGAATPQYQCGNSDVQALICCGAYGQEYRNSDPHIGYSVNRIVGGEGNLDGLPRLVCLADPMGLYIQSPDLSGLRFGPAIVPGKTVPAGAKPTDVFQIARGTTAPTDPVTGQPFPGDMLLHIVFQIPASWLAMTPVLTLADLQFSGKPITWAGQIAGQIKIALFARPLATAATPPNMPCAGAPSPAAPLQCMFQTLWDGYYTAQEQSPNGQAISLASNSVIVPPWLPAGGGTMQLVLICNSPAPLDASVNVLSSDGSGPDPQIKVCVTAAQPVSYAVPGNSYPGNYTALSLSVNVAEGASPGLRAVQVANGGTLPAALLVKTAA